MNLLHNTTHFTLILTNNNKSIDNSYILSTLYSDLSIIKMFSRTITAAFLAVYPLLVDADCSSFTSTSFIQLEISSLYHFAVESLACPSTSQSNCIMPPFNLNLTITPQVNFTSLPGSSVSQSDQAAIISIASQAYAQNSTFPSQPFVTHSVVVSSSDIPQDAQNILSVIPGSNQTAYFEPMFMSATGTLGGCTNSALNDLTATVYAAYANVTGDQGGSGWDSYGIGPATSSGTPTTSATPTPSKSGKPNAAGTLKGGIWSGLLLTLGVFVSI
jgi:hypothetical protein